MVANAQARLEEEMEEEDYPLAIESASSSMVGLKDIEDDPLMGLELEGSEV